MTAPPATSATTATTTATPGTLVRNLTLIPAAAVVLAYVIGTGVFLKARVMTANVETPGMVLTVWFIAGLLSLAGALVYAELSAMMPRAGGEYNYLGAAYGRPTAFMFGWTRTLALGASNAAISIALVIFLNDALGPDRALHPTVARLLPVAVILTAAGLNLASVKSTASIAVALTVVKVALVVGVAAGAFWLSDGSWGHFLLSGADGRGEGVAASARGGIGGFSAAMLGALWGYSGWSMVASIAGEVKDPARTLPRALIGGVCAIILLYLFINAAYFYALTPRQVADVPASSSVAREVAGRFFGKGAAGLIACGLMVSAFGTLHTGLLTGARIPYALARDGLLPAALARTTRAGTPAVAVTAVAAWSILLTLTGTFDTLTDIYIFTLWIFYGLTTAAVFILRRTRPDAVRPYRAWGYPVVPALFLLASGFLLVSTLFASPLKALAGLGLIAAGLPVYLIYARRLGPAKPRSEQPPER